MRKYNDDVLVITMCDLMLEGMEVKEAVDKYCEDNEFVLVEYEEYGETYENGLGEFAQVKIAVVDGDQKIISKAYDAKEGIIREDENGDLEWVVDGSVVMYGPVDEYYNHKRLEDMKGPLLSYILDDGGTLKVKEIKSETTLYRATKKYDKANTTQVHLKLNKNTDADILEKLGQVESKQGYIKALIRADISC